jgi:hypothetical protein
MPDHWSGKCSKLCLHGDDYVINYTPLSLEQATNLRNKVFEHLAENAAELLCGGTTNALEGLNGTLGRSALKVFDYPFSYPLYVAFVHDCISGRYRRHSIFCSHSFAVLRYASLPSIDRVLVPSLVSPAARAALFAAAEHVGASDALFAAAATTPLPPVGGLPARASILTTMGVPLPQYTYNRLARLQLTETNANNKRSTVTAKQQRRRRKLARRQLISATPGDAAHTYGGGNGGRLCGVCKQSGHNARTCKNRAGAAAASSDGGGAGGGGGIVDDDAVEEELQQDGDDDDVEEDNSGSDSSDDSDEISYADDDDDNDDNNDDEVAAREDITNSSERFQRAVDGDMEVDSTPIVAAVSSKGRSVKPSSRYDDSMRF